MSDSESDQVKYKAAKRTLQSRSLRFLLTEKSQVLGLSAQRGLKFWLPYQNLGISLCQDLASVKSLIQAW